MPQKPIVLEGGGASLSCTAGWPCFQTCAAVAILRRAAHLLQVYGSLTTGLYRFNVWVAGQSQQQAAMGSTYAITSVSAQLLPAPHHLVGMMHPGQHRRGGLHVGHAQLPLRCRTHVTRWFSIVPQAPSQPLQLCTGTARHWYVVYLQQQGCIVRSSGAAERVDALRTQVWTVAERLAPVVQMLAFLVLQGPAVQLLRSPSAYIQSGSATFAYGSDAAAGFQCRLTDKKVALPASYRSCSSPT